jgi:hypothetical protein
MGWDISTRMATDAAMIWDISPRMTQRAKKTPGLQCNNDLGGVV